MRFLSRNNLRPKYDNNPRVVGSNPTGRAFLELQIMIWDLQTYLISATRIPKSEITL